MSPSVQNLTTSNQYKLLRNEEATFLIEIPSVLNPTTANRVEPIEK